MSSAKVRNTFLIAVALLLGLAVAVVAWRFTRGGKGGADIAGFWEGALQVQGVTLRLVLKVDKSPDGAYSATIDSIDQGAKDIPVNTVTLNNEVVRVDLTSLNAAYEGKLNSRATEMSGDWRQMGTSHPLTFKRTTTPSTIAAPLPASAYARRKEAPLQGHWKGTIETGAAALRVIFKISERTPGQYGGALNSIDQGAKDVPLSTVEFAEPTARFEIASIDGHFEGALKDDGNEIAGTWMQMGKSFVLLLKRTDPAAETPVVSDSAYVFISETELPGIWNGALDVQGKKLRLAVKIAKAADGSYSGVLDSLDQGAKDIPITTITFQDSEVQLEWKAIGALYHGTLEKGKLVGNWQQGPADFPLDFERTNRVASAGATKEKN